MVEVDGSDEGFEGVASDIAVVRRIVAVLLYQFGESHLDGEAVECLSLNHLAPCVGEESLTFPVEAAENDVAHYGIEHGIAEKLESLVIDEPSFLVALSHAFV